MELQTKFIEGTNEQYSIREDGVVTRYYNFTRYYNSNNLRYRTKIYNTVIIKGSKTESSTTKQYTFNGKSYTESFLLIKYFGYKKCRTCEKEVKTIVHRYCQSCIKIQDKKALTKFRQIHKVRLAKNQKKNDAIHSKEMSKRYIAALLKIPLSLTTDEIYNSKKDLLLFKKELCKKYNVKIETFN